jgi:hypothetical protein
MTWVTGEAAIFFYTFLCHLSVLFAERGSPFYSNKAVFCATHFVAHHVIP